MLASRLPVPYLLLAAIAVIAACSSSNNSGTSNVGCTISLSGAVLASPACTSIEASYSADFDSTFFVVHSPQAGFSYFLEPGGRPHTGTYRDTDPGANDEGVFYTAGGITWYAGFTQGVGVVPGSNYTLNLTSVAAGTTSGDATPYTLHGTADATLVSTTAGTTPIAVHITF
jgi:hypothetical protein